MPSPVAVPEAWSRLSPTYSLNLVSTQINLQAGVVSPSFVC